MNEQSVCRTSGQCRLVLIEGQTKQILTVASPSGPRLPREAMSLQSRVAESLTEAVKCRYGTQTIQLALLDAQGGSNRVAVHEIIGQSSPTPESLSSVVLQDSAEGELAEWEQAMILKIINGEANGLGRFARCGWIDELLSILRETVTLDSKPVVTHMNQGIDFCLLKLRNSSGRGLWFKAVGEENCREFAMTLELASRFPQYLPKIVATIPEWNGWVMEDAEGVPLNECDSIVPCEQALAALALMQREMAGDVRRVFLLGAKDWTCKRMTFLLDPFFTEVRFAMKAQRSNKVKPLTGCELSQLEDRIRPALREFMSTDIPETLLHGDIGHGNIIARHRGPIFLDWAETYVGHPFVCAEHLLADLARSNPLFLDGQAFLRSRYAAYWKDYVRPQELKRTIALAPAVAALAYALFAWDANRCRPEPQLVWPILRTMVRNTKRALDAVPEACRGSLARIG